MGWQAAVASVAYFIATMIQVLAMYNNPSYVPERWHATLIMILLAILYVLVNTIGKSLLPMTETVGGVLHVLVALGTQSMPLLTQVQAVLFYHHGGSSCYRRESQ